MIGRLFRICIRRPTDNLVSPSENWYFTLRVDTRGDLAENRILRATFPACLFLGVSNQKGGICGGIKPDSVVTALYKSRG